LFIGIFILVLYVSIVLHFDGNPNNRDYEHLYQMLGKTEQKEKAFMTFTKHGKMAGDYLVSKLRVERDSFIKSDVIQIIGLTGCSNCDKQLIFFLYDPDWRVRFFTVDTLDKLKCKNFLDLLPDIITKDSDENVKTVAIMMLGKHGSAKEITFLEDLFKRSEYQDKKLNTAIESALLKLKSSYKDKE